MMHISNAAPVQALERDTDVESDRRPSQTGFGRMRSPNGGPLKVAILSDFARISYANGAVFQTRRLYRELLRAGHKVTIIAPHDPNAQAAELPPDLVQVPSRPMRAYPGVHIPLPLDKSMFDPHRWDFDIVFGQTTSLLIDFGLWLRKMRGVPLLCVNTTHLPAAYEVLLPNWMAKAKGVRTGIVNCLQRPFEKLFCNLYNESDGLIVLSDGLRDYWRKTGVKVPIHVIPRAVSRDIFDVPTGADPYASWLEKFQLPTAVQRLVCAGRHTPEKEQDRIIRIFATQILPQAPNSALFMLGTGPHSHVYRQLAADLGVQGRVIFTGEVRFQEMPDYYRHADVFLHASRSETFGNVLGEALWSGMAVVAFADGMGVSSQVCDRQNGYLVQSNIANAGRSDREFARAAVSLLSDAITRRRFGKEAARLARLCCSPDVVEELTASAFESARLHAQYTVVVPGVQRSQLSQWATTAKHVQRWGVIMGSVYLSGQLRAPAGPLPSLEHPSFA